MSLKGSAKDITGRIYGDLKVVGMYYMNMFTKDGKQNLPVWECQCGCGNLIKVCARHLKSNKKTHCGCGYERKIHLNRRTLVYGWGINDADYLIVDSNGEECPYYTKWTGMLARSKSHRKFERESTKDTDCCEDWKYFSNFKSWMEQQVWDKNSQLDKDILVKGNKLYSPETCCFVPLFVNTALQQRKSENILPLGVSGSNDGPRKKKYSAICQGRSFGRYLTVEEAHKAWQEAKVNSFYKLLEQYAKETTFNTKVADAILTRAWNIKLQIMNKEETVYF